MLGIKVSRPSSVGSLVQVKDSCLYQAFQMEVSESQLLNSLKVLRLLEMQGYVSWGDERNGSVLWSLQEHVHSKLCLVARLGKPQPFATSALQTDVKCMTVMELMLLLQKEGFVFLHWDGSSSEPEPFNVCRRIPKAMFLKAGGGAMQFSRWYLLALELPSLKDCGTQSVQHCQPDRYYKQLLEPVMGPIGSRKRKHGHGQPALVFQVDAGAIPVEPPQQNTAAAPTVQRRVRGKRPDKKLDVSARALKPSDTPAALKDADPVADPSAGAVPAAPVDAAAARASKQEQQKIKKKQRQDKSHN